MSIHWQVTGMNTTEVSLQLAEFVNATCACGGTAVTTGSNITFGSAGGGLLQAFNNSVNGTTDWATYQASVCRPLFGAANTSACTRAEGGRCVQSTCLKGTELCSKQHCSRVNALSPIRI
jgi:hypothetical protein